MNYEEKYNKALGRAKERYSACSAPALLEYIFPELKESEDERIKREILEYINSYANLKDEKIPTEWIEWIEKQGERLENYDEAEKEKADFVGDGFIECHADFLEFKEGSTYWLEYIGDDKYNVRSDNLLGKTYHITPCQLYTVFKKLTWLEKQDKQPTDKVEPKFKPGDTMRTLQEAANGYTDGMPVVVSIDNEYYHCTNELIAIKDQDDYEFPPINVKQKSSDKVEPKFHPEDWLQYRNAEPFFVEEITEQGYCNGESCLPFEWEDEIHLWAIEDAKDGDTLVMYDIQDNIQWLFLCRPNPHKLRLYDPRFYCHYDLKSNTFKKDADYVSVAIGTKFRPATKEQRDLLFEKMKEAGYKWDSAKKELKKIEQNPVDKVEAKFHPGDWIIDNEYSEVLKVTKSDADSYEITNQDGEIFDILKEDVECNHRLWSIDDAKDGDVLVDAYGNIGIFDKCYDFDWLSSCSLVNNGGFQYFTVKHGNEKTHPATKEQRELLFQNMKEAGCEWDGDKKELKRIEQKTVDHVGPKFKADNYIVLDNITSSEIWRVINIDKDGYYNIQRITNPEYDEIYRVPAFILEKDYRLWTIADARDGDVLAFNDNTIVIFKDLYNSSTFHSYCHIEDGIFGISKDDTPDWWAGNGFQPATKEQRELLFQNMKESGWEWDNEKKELKKFETKFNVDDWIVTDDSFGKIVRHIDAISFNLIDRGYVVSDENGLIYNNISFDSEHKWHKWTIRDAEDGDVLASALTGSIFLFRGIKDNKIDFYCDYDTNLEWPEPEPDDRFGINDTNQHYGRVEESQDIHPATKEQRDLLFEKMKEEGCEFDNEKKELMKIGYKTLDAGKVIEWIRKYWPFKCFGNVTLLSDDVIEQFKKDFGL